MIWYPRIVQQASIAKQTPPRHALLWALAAGSLTTLVTAMLVAVRVRPSSGDEWLRVSVISAVVLVWMIAWMFIFLKAWLAPRLFQLLTAALAVAVLQFLIWDDPDADWWNAGVIAVLLAMVILFTRFWKQWWIRSPREDASVLIIVSSCSVALVMLVLFFSVLTGVLVAKDFVESNKELRRGAVFDLQGYYAWHFFDAIPGLKIPQTLNWQKPTDVPVGWEGGLLLFIFKLAVILPVIAAVRDSWKRLKPKEPPTKEAQTASR